MVGFWWMRFNLVDRVKTNREEKERGNNKRIYNINRTNKYFVGENRAFQPEGEITLLLVVMKANPTTD